MLRSAALGNDYVHRSGRIRRFIIMVAMRIWFLKIVLGVISSSFVGPQFMITPLRCAPPVFFPGAAIAIPHIPYRKALWINVFGFTRRSGDTGRALKDFLCAEPQHRRMRLS